MADYPGEGFDPSQALGEGTAAAAPGEEMGAGVVTAHYWVASGTGSPTPTEKWDGKCWAKDPSCTRLGPPEPLATSGSPLRLPIAVER